MLSKISIKNFSFILAIIISVALTLLIICLIIFFEFPITFVQGCLFLLLSFGLCYFLLKVFMERMILHRIKPIYKIIRDSKLSPQAKEARLKTEKNQSFSDINDEVVHWAESAQKEISTLKALETYRKNFVGNISHELKTPIFSIQGYLHTLLDGGMDDPSVSLRFLRKAADNATRLQTIVEDLELINKLESGQPIFNMVSFDIKELINEIYMDLQNLAAESDITLGWKDKATGSIKVFGDKEAIRQVLINLMVNSIKYGKSGGLTEVGFFDISDQILIEVSDNGIGIGENHIKHLFDRFYRVDKGRSRKQGGSGLGLSIVKHIIEAHGQTINVRSTINVGSTFGFTLNKAQ